MSNKIQFYYTLPSKYSEYENTLLKLDINKGNLTELLNQVKNNKQFCREEDENDINYEYFIESIELNNDICLYIVDLDIPDNFNIAGCCVFSIQDIDEKKSILIWGICVPNRSPKKYGTQILNKLKQFGKYSNINNIQLSAGKNYINFYKKNNFVLLNDEDEEDTSIPMIYQIKGGKKNNKSIKRKIKKKNKIIINRKSRKSRNV
jgi:hypothetical protein